MKKAQQEQIEAMKEARSERLAVLKSEQEESLRMLKENQQAQLDALKETIDLQKKEVETWGEVEGAAKLSTELFEQLGVSLKDTNGDMKSTEDVLLDTIAALAEMDDEVQRDVLANQIFGKSFTELRPLINGSADGLRDLMDEADEYGMVMSDDAVAASAAFADSLTKMQGTLKGIKNRFGGELLPALTQVMDGFSDFVAGIDGGEDKIAEGVKGLIDTVKKSLPEVGKFAESIKKAIMTQIPEILQSIMTELVKAVPGLAQTLLDITNDVLDMLLDMLPTIMDAVVSLVTQILDTLGQILPQIAEKVAEVLPTLVDTLVGAIPTLLDAAIKFLSTIADAVPEVVPKLVDALPKIIQSVTEMLVNNLPQIVKAATTMLMGIVKAIPKMLPDLMRAVVEMVGSIGAWLIQEVPTLQEAGKELLFSLLDAAPELAKAWQDALAGMFEVVGEVLLKPLVESFGLSWDAVVEKAKEAWEGIKAVFATFGDFFGNVLSGAWEKIKNVFSMGGMLFEGIKDGIVNAFKTIVNTLIIGINDVIAAPFNAINDMLNSIHDIDILGLKPFEDLWERDPLKIPSIPLLAQGGVLRKGQMGLLEGSGAEAVVPLENNKAWISAVAADMLDTIEGMTGAGGGVFNRSNNVNFVQNNYSPKALSRLEVYRQTKNLTAMLKGATV